MTTKGLAAVALTMLMSGVAFAADGSAVQAVGDHKARAVRPTRSEAVGTGAHHGRSSSR